MSKIELPPLPDPMWGPKGNRPYGDAYSAEQMLDYARAAVLADRAARVDAPADELKMPSELLLLARDPLMGPAMMRFIKDIQAATKQPRAGDWDRFHHIMDKAGLHPGRTDDNLLDILERHFESVAAAPDPLRHVTTFNTAYIEAMKMITSAKPLSLEIDEIVSRRLGDMMEGDTAPAEPVGMTPKELVERVKRGEKWEVVPPAEPEQPVAWMARKYDEAADLWEWDAYTVEMYEKRKDDGRYYEWTPLFTHPHRSDAWVAEAIGLLNGIRAAAMQCDWITFEDDHAALLKHLKGE